MLDLAATFLVFARDAEASALVLGKDLDRLHIQNYSSHGSLDQDKDINLEHRTVWGGHPERSGTVPEEVTRSHNHHIVNAGIKDRLLYQKNGVRSMGAH